MKCNQMQEVRGKFSMKVSNKEKNLKQSPQIYVEKHNNRITH